MATAKNLIDQFPVALTARDLTSYDVYLCKEDKSVDGRMAFNNLFANLGTGTNGLRLGAGAGAGQAGQVGNNNNTTIGVNAGSAIDTGTNNVIITDGVACPMMGNGNAFNNIVLSNNGFAPNIQATATLNDIVALCDIGLLSATTVQGTELILAGDNVLGAVTSATLSNVIAMGSSVLSSVTTGTLRHTIAMGTSSGLNVTDGDHNFFLGNVTGIDSPGTANYRTAIGTGALATADHQVCLGTTAETLLLPSGTAISSPGHAWDLISTPFSVISSSQSGVDFNISASDAVDGSGSHASRNGGFVLLTVGDGVNGGTSGQVNISDTAAIWALDIAGTSSTVSLTTGTGNALSLTATAPTAVSASQAGVGITLTASNAVDGTGSHGAAAGGNVGLYPGAGVNGGVNGAVIPPSDGNFYIGTTSLRYKMYAYAFSDGNTSPAGGIFAWSSNTGGLRFENAAFSLGSASVFGFSSGDVNSNARDVGLARSAAGVLELNNGTVGTPASAPGITIPNAASGAGKTFTLTGSSAAGSSGAAGGPLVFLTGARDGSGTYGYMTVAHNGDSLPTPGSYTLNVVDPDNAGSALQLWANNLSQKMQIGWNGFVASNALNFSSSGNMNFTAAGGVAQFACLFGRYSNIATAGWGVPAIYGSGDTVGATGQTTSNSTYTVGAADGTFLITCNILVTTATTHSFTAEVAYTDEGSTTRVLTLSYTLLAGGALGTLVINTNGAVPYEYVPVCIRCKAATAITVRTNAGGTYTTVAYNMRSSIQQIA